MKFSIYILSLLILFNACATEEEPKPLETGPLQDPVETPAPPMNSQARAMGTFTSYAHGLSGKAVIYVDDKNQRTLRLENFNMTPGPDVYVFLSKSNNYSAGGTVPITMLKGGYANSDISLTLNDDVNLTTHKFVLVYCVQFSSLFGFAEPM